MININNLKFRMYDKTNNEFLRYLRAIQFNKDTTILSILADNQSDKNTQCFTISKYRPEQADIDYREYGECELQIYDNDDSISLKQKIVCLIKNYIEDLNTDYPGYGIGECERKVSSEQIDMLKNLLTDIESLEVEE